MLQNNPEIQKWRERLRLTPKVFLILFAFAATVILVRSLQAKTFIFNPILLIPFAILIGVCGRLFGNILWSTRKSLLRLQECALAGDASLLADRQPVPNEQALPFPTIIDWRPKTSALAFTVIITTIIILAIFLPFIVFITPSSQLPHILLTLALGLLGSFVLILIVEHFSAQKGKRQSSGMQEVEHERMDNEGKIDIATTKGFFSLLGMQLVGIDEEGLTAWTFETGSVVIPWSQARLFSIVRGGHGSKSQLVYMLASERACACWVDAPSHSFWPLTLYRPLLPDADHQQKMQELLQVIAGKTGLPLYDLRKKAQVPAV